MRFGRHFLHPLPGRIDLEMERVWVWAHTCMQMFTAHTENESLWEGLVKMGQVMHSLLRFCDISVVLKCLERVGVDRWVCWAAWLGWNAVDGFTGVNNSCWESPEAGDNPAGHLLCRSSVPCLWQWGSQPQKWLFCSYLKQHVMIKT